MGEDPRDVEQRIAIGRVRLSDALAVDPITAEIVRSALVAITDEMKTNLMRTAYHTIIYEAEDFTVGLFDADGKLYVSDNNKRVYSFTLAP